MGNASKTFLKTVRAIVIILALVFTSNIDAQQNKRKRGKHGSNYGNNYGNHGGNRHSGNRQGGNRRGDCIPIDGGLSILLLGAAAFGIKRLRGNKKDEV